MQLNEVKILDDYNNGMSPQEIADRHGTYANKIRRIVKKYVPVRGRSEANKLALERGTKKHPTKGKTLSKEHKEKISETIAQQWNEMSEEKYEKYVDGCRERWNNMSVEDKQRLNEAANEGIRKSAELGSKLEHYVVEQIKLTGLSIDQHKKGLIPNDKLEVDIFLPDIATCIEIDGPSHFFPIWGQDHLNKQIKADIQKAGLLLNAGFVLIRVKCTANHISEKVKRDLINQLVPKLLMIKKKRPVNQLERFIELEV